MLYYKMTVVMPNLHAISPNAKRSGKRKDNENQEEQPTKTTYKYPIFIRCARKTEDQFWRKIFQNLALGVPPRGVSFDPNTNSIYCNYKGREFNYRFDENTSATKIFQDVHSLFRDKLRMVSTQDHENRRVQIQEIKKNIQIQSQTDLKDLTASNNWLTDAQILAFVQQAQTEHALSALTARRLNRLVSLMNAFSILPEFIRDSSGKITFKDLKFKTSNGKGSFSFVLAEVKIKTSIKTKRKNLADKWGA
jgi:hypothetical protein